jgi:hypothetical protein
MPRFLAGTFAAAILAALSIGAPAQTSATVERAADTITFTGRIDAASAARFLALLQEPGTSRIVITSQGGDVAAALDMAQAIHERGLDVEVPKICLSSCANYVFPAGRRKLLGRAWAVGWHGNMAHVLYLAQLGAGNWSAEAIKSARELALREAALYARLGVDGFVCWFGKIAPYDAPDFYYLSPEDMARFGIDSVTVQDTATPPPDGELRFLRVDWATLEAIRPPVRLNE